MPRRGILRALALLPAALAGCAAAKAERAPGPGLEPSAAPPARALPPGAVAAVRGFQLSGEGEPALVFRAAAARPGDPR